MQLSPSTAYYIRKLLHKQHQNLRFIVAPGAGVKADSLADLNQVLESLYLEEPEIEVVVYELEKLTTLHQLLLNQPSIYAQEVADLEKRIFWILGFKAK